MTNTFFVLLLLAMLQAAVGYGVRTTSNIARSSIRMAERVNTKIDLDAAKVVHTIEVEKKMVLCRCWKSGTFPMCDGAHNKHNEATGDNLGPLIVSPKTN